MSSIFLLQVKFFLSNFYAMDKDYMTSAEAREYLRVGKNTLLKFRRLGLPFVKVARKVLYRKSDIDAFMEKHIIKRTESPKKRFSRQ